MGFILATIAVQVASAAVNAYRGNKQNSEFQKRQQEYESKVLRDGIENSRQEFAALCQLQRDMEYSMNEDRLNTIRLNSRTTMELTAYAHSLRSWPLLVPPFVIKNSTLPLLENIGSQEQTIIPLNCILTTSMNPKFNTKVFPQLEESLAKFCLSYWNPNTGRGIRFYQQAWKNNITDVGAKIYDIKAHLEGVPTLVLSPYIESGKLMFSFSWWGMNTNASDEHINDKYDPELPAVFTEDFKYGDDDISELLGSLVFKLEAFISYFADMYYWNFYKEVPQLPLLISHGTVKVCDSFKQELSQTYLTSLSQDGNMSDVNSSLDYFDSISRICDVKEIAKSRIIDRVNKCQLTIEEMNRVQEFGKTHIRDIVDGIIHKMEDEEIENVEIVENTNVDLQHILEFAYSAKQEAFCAHYFVFLYWSNNIVVGTFCKKDFLPCVYELSNQTRFFVIMNGNATFHEDSDQELIFNAIDLTTNKFLNMEKRERSIRERVGQRLINVGKRLKGYDDEIMHCQSPWDDNMSTQKKDELQVIKDYFVNGVNQDIINFTRNGNDMSIDLVLNWLDALSDQAIGRSNQMYVVKINYQAKGKILYCTFLAKNDVFDLEASPKHCFICDSESSEMRDLFSGKHIYIIPFED